jgi:hypothetical protein
MDIEIDKTFFPLTINIFTNKSSKSFAFTKDLLFFPPKEKERVKNPATKEQIPINPKKPANKGGALSKQYDEPNESKDSKENTGSSSVPFYTDEKEYPVKKLKGKKQFYSYFDTVAYEDNLGDIKYDATDEAKYEIANANIKGMLEIFFPTSLPNPVNINTSYDQDIRKVASSTITGTWIPEWLYGFFGKEESNYSYVVIGGKKYTVLKVLWINDVFSHPLYRKFFKNISYLKNAEDRTLKVLNRDLTKFQAKLGNMSYNKRDLEESLDKVKKDLSRSSARLSENVNPNYPATINAIRVLSTTHNRLDTKALFDIYLCRQSSQSDILPSALKTRDFYEKMNRAVDLEKTRMLIGYIENPSELNRDSKDKDVISQYRVALFKKELEKLGGFGKLTKQIQQFISRIKSSNPSLQKTIDDFISGENVENIFNLAKVVNREIPESEIPGEFYPMLETGVVNMNASKKKEKDKEETQSEPRFEIYVKLELLDALIDDKKNSKNNCLYRNNLLVQRYTELKKTAKNTKGLLGGSSKTFRTTKSTRIGR